MMGGTDYAMRLWLRPDRMAQLGLTPSDVAAAVSEQNAQFAAGRSAPSPPARRSTSPIPSMPRAGSASPRSSRTSSCARCRMAQDPVKDVARVELGGNDYDVTSMRSSKPSVGISTYLQPNANALKVSAAIAAKMESSRSASRRGGLRHSLRHHQIRQGIYQRGDQDPGRGHGAGIPGGLSVPAEFPRHADSCVAVPVSLIGTFAGMLLLGFSINLLTLFGMVLAIGIVVDDAIVVLENVERIMSERRCSAKEAAVLAMQEVSAPWWPSCWYCARCSCRWPSWAA